MLICLVVIGNAYPKIFSTNKIKLRFHTVRNWKENISGNWQLQVTDKVTGDTGTLNNWKIEIFAYDPTVNGTVIATTGTIPDADSLATKSFVNYAMMIAVALIALLL